MEEKIEKVEEVKEAQVDDGLSAEDREIVGVLAKASPKEQADFVRSARAAIAKANDISTIAAEIKSLKEAPAKTEKAEEKKLDKVEALELEMKSLKGELAQERTAAKTAAQGAEQQRRIDDAIAEFPGIKGDKDLKEAAELMGYGALVAGKKPEDVIRAWARKQTDEKIETGKDKVRAKLSDAGSSKTGGTRGEGVTKDTANTKEEVFARLDEHLAAV